jgi:hypothetical protein
MIGEQLDGFIGRFRMSPLLQSVERLIATET